MPYRYFLFSLIFICFNTLANSHNLSELNSHNDYFNIGKFTSFFKESNKDQLNIKQIQQRYNDGEFTQWTTDVPSFRIGASTHWVTTFVNNTTQHSTQRRLVIETPWLDEIIVYAIHNGNTTTQHKFGDSLPFHDRPQKHRFFIFDHSFKPGKTQLFLRINSVEPMVVPLFFGSQETYAERDTFNHYSYGMLYGLIIGLLFYNFIIYFRIREKRYLFYVIFLFSFLIMNFTYSGHSYQLLWPNAVQWQFWSNTFFITLYSLFGLIFSLSFLRTKTLFPHFYHLIIKIIIGIVFVQACLILLGYLAIAIAFAVSLILFYGSVALFLGFKSLNKGSSDIKYFLIASIASLVGMSITALVGWGVIPYSDFTFRGAELGLCIDAILLSNALAERLRITQEEKLFAERTSKIDSLTDLYNRRAFDEYSKKIWSNALRHHQPLSMLILDIDNFKSINDTHGHITGDEVIIAISDILKKTIREEDLLSRWGGDEFTILLPETNLPNAAEFALRLKQSIAETTIKTNKINFNLTISVGVSTKSDAINSLLKLLTDADDNLYQAKQKGKNTVWA